MKAIFMATGILAMLSLSACERKDNIENSPAPEVAVMTDDAATVAETAVPDAGGEAAGDEDAVIEPVRVSGSAARFGQRLVRLGDKLPGHFDKENNYWDCGENEKFFSTSPGNHDYAVLSVQKKLGLVDKNGVIVVLPVYSGLRSGFDKNGFCQVHDAHGTKCGLVNRSGREVLPVEYDDIWSDQAEDGLIKVRKNGREGFVNFQGKVVIPIQYPEGMVQAGEDLIWFMAEPARWGCINYKNEVVVKPEFTYTSRFENGKTVSQKADGENYTIYKDGRIEKK